MVAGIYLITNKINGHMYVGGSVDIKKRFGQHKRGEYADIQAIDRAILKYGKENFSYQIITELPADWEIIGEHEKYWINFYNTFKNKKHYNLTKGGESPPVMYGKDNPMYGNPNKIFIGKKNPNYGNPSNYKPSDKFLMNISKAKNKTGFYGVSKHKKKSCIQGFIWRYRYTEDGKQKEISSVDFFKLKNKVKEQGFLWTVVDIEKAVETVRGLYD